MSENLSPFSRNLTDDCTLLTETFWSHLDLPRKYRGYSTSKVGSLEPRANTLTMIEYQKCQRCNAVPQAKNRFGYVIRQTAWKWGSGTQGSQTVAVGCTKCSTLKSRFHITSGFCTVCGFCTLCPFGDVYVVLLLKDWLLRRFDSLLRIRCRLGLV